MNKRVILSFLSGLLWAGFFVPISAQEDKSSQNTIVDAVALYNDGKWSEARSLLLPILSEGKENDAAYYYLGLCDIHLNDIEEAETFLRKAVDLDPHNFWYKYSLAGLYSSEGKTELTADLFESMLEDFPKRTQLYYNLVSIYASQNKIDKVLETLSEIEASSGKSEMVTLARYDVMMSLDKPDEAFRVLEDYNKEFASPQILAAMGDAKLSNYEDTLALSYYEEALSYDPDCVQALLGKAEVNRVMRRYPEFFSVAISLASNAEVMPQPKIQYISSVLQHMEPRLLSNYRPQLDSMVNACLLCHPSDTMAIEMAGSYYYNTQRSAEAKDCFRRNVDLNPESFYSRVMYVQFLAYAKLYEDLIEESEKAFEDFPDQLAFLDMKSIGYYNLGDFESLVKENERIVRIAPKDTSVTLRAYANVGDAYHLLGQTKKSFAAYQKALKINPQYVPVLNNYAYYLSQEGKNLRKAYSMSKITIEKEPDNPTYLDTFGWILFLQGKAVEAKPFFKHAMLHGGKESKTVLLHYAEVLYALGEDDLARVYENMAEKLK